MVISFRFSACNPALNVIILLKLITIAYKNSKECIYLISPWCNPSFWWHDISYSPLLQLCSFCFISVIMSTSCFIIEIKGLRWHGSFLLCILKEYAFICQTFRNMFWSSSGTKNWNYNGKKELTLDIAQWAIVTKIILTDAMKVFLFRLK